jgi:hypothetical protein
MESLDLYLSRQKETQNWLLLALGIGLGIAVAARVPVLIISLPLTWISGGMSVAFLWVAGPPVLWFLHAMAFNALFESERARKFARETAEKQRASLFAIARDDKTLTLAGNSELELQPVLSGDVPLALTLLHGTLWLAPVLVNCVLFGSYLQFVRPNAANGWVFATRNSQEFDALLGTGGWGWLRPLAPSLDGNLAELIGKAENKDTRDKYESLRKQIPYVFFPLQTWLYIAGILFGLDLATRALQTECGADPPAGLIAWIRSARNRFRRRSH